MIELPVERRRGRKRREKNCDRATCDPTQPITKEVEGSSNRVNFLYCISVSVLVAKNKYNVSSKPQKK